VREVTLSDGRKYQVTAVSDTLVNMVKEAVRKEFEAKGEQTLPPTYTVIGAGEVSHQEPHDETTLETDEDRAAWKNYQDTLARLTVETNNRVMKVWMTGLRIDLPEDDNWLQVQKWFGVNVPENPMDLRYHYITTEILRSPEDLFTVLNDIMKESYKGMVKEDDLEAAINSFRDNLQGKASKQFHASQKPLETHGETE
jgi:hypothetical protein